MTNFGSVRDPVQCHTSLKDILCVIVRIKGGGSGMCVCVWGRGMWCLVEGVVCGA